MSYLFTKFISHLTNDAVKFTGDMRETPSRFTSMYYEFLSGLREDPPEMKTFKSDVDELVVVSGIEFVSLCSHHLIPFYGTASIGYLPRGKILGISKFSRALDHWAKRPQVQEGLTQQYADFLQKHLRARFLIVVLEATHCCMALRGVKQMNAVMKTVSIKGSKNPSLKAEFFEMIRR